MICNFRLLSHLKRLTLLIFIKFIVGKDITRDYKDLILVTKHLHQRNNSSLRNKLQIRKCLGRAEAQKIDLP